MADASEDALHQPGANPDGPDLEDEVQDYRFLLTTSKGQKIPSRGIKDFEPHGTNLQQSTLDASREAMHMALSSTRFHQSSAQRAIYDEIEHGAWVVNEGGSWAKSVGIPKKVPESQRWLFGMQKHTEEELEGEDLEDSASTAKDEDDDLLFSSPSANDKISKAKKNKVQKKDNEPRLWLLPEEALWLIERGTLEISWPADVGEDTSERLPMSIQAAHAVFLGMEKAGGLTLEEYTVYQYLKRAGFIVLRARDNLHNVPNYKETTEWPNLTSFWKKLFSKQPPALSRRGKTGPLVQPGLYRSYDDIFRMLALIPTNDPTSDKNISPRVEDPDALNVTYHVYKARSGYKKTAPGPPDFYFSVLNARQTSVPTEPQIDALLKQTPYHPPDPKHNLYKKLKEGYRNVILAVVDQGVTSFIDVSDSGFGEERLWGREKKPFRGGKRGGRGGGRGRGRGRGRGS
ncbi:hypothetical protein FKW77_006569 [Venturia effusa]|uniref:tRNA-splicing endonuclease subunit Sen54 N-terminal domain-containing protein n=1 Tax=Venturia effusa TaxID=50376 RepID=A0A517LFS3_9PEZI|nr:hypothetical protein FKW77_006569 [Venturia effusa]